MMPDARRRLAGALMTEQFNRPTPQDTEVVERGGLLPVGTYANGMSGPALPGFIYDGLFGPGDAASGKLGNYQDNREEWAKVGFDTAGAAMVGGLAAPRPKAVATAERIGMSGRPDGTEPIKGYRGSAWGSSVAPSFNREPIYWASSNPELAADYAAHSFGRAGPSVTPAEFRFRNPLEIDADGAGWQQIPYGGKTSITDKVAMDARKAGHDGVVFRNVVDDVNGNMTAADTIAALQPGTVYSPLTGELLFANGGKQGAAVGAATNALAERPGIRAYHGSPHDFDKFDMSKIGTGEGAQAYGHGLYFAENEAVAQSYKGTGPRAPTSGPNAGQVHYAVKGPDGYDYQFHPLGSKPDTGSPYLTSDKALAERIAQENGGKIRDTSGKMYEVRINASPDDFLDWDKPLSQQSEKVRALFPNAAPDTPGAELMRMAQGLEAQSRPPQSGDAMRDRLSLMWHNMNASVGTTKGASEAALKDAGITGIRYLDQGSRSQGEGSRNYVVFDDNLVEILRKYGLLGMAGGAAANEIMSNPNKAIAQQLMQDDANKYRGAI